MPPACFGGRRDWILNRLRPDSASVVTLNEILWGTIFDSTNWVVNMNDGKFFKFSFPSWTEVHDNVNTWGGLGLFGDSQIDNFTEKGFLYFASNGWAGRYQRETDTWTMPNHEIPQIYLLRQSAIFGGMGHSRKLMECNENHSAAWIQDQVAHASH
ncbi:MAG: hypothetical protein UT97_C0020G0004 [Parcubacteria group bacterium GW2011_GWC2_40_31]|nr:MAG: hypothetical protein UT97_C0020G0004 [Parcubacteria group bacterium GW2011_GWC2_40_31]